MFKAIQLKVTPTDDMSETQFELANPMSGPDLDFVSPQLQHSSPDT